MSVSVDIVADVMIPNGAEKWIRRPLELLAKTEPLYSLCVLLTDSEEIRRLNREFRDMDSITDVLSFPSGETGPDVYAGDIAICLERAREQAHQLGHSLEQELSFLALHGALHLLGWDHEDPDEAERMYRRQREIMSRVIRNPDEQT